MNEKADERDVIIKLWPAAPAGLAPRRLGAPMRDAVVSALYHLGLNLKT